MSGMARSSRPRRSWIKRLIGVRSVAYCDIVYCDIKIEGMGRYSDDMIFCKGMICWYNDMMIWSMIVCRGMICWYFISDAMQGYDILIFHLNYNDYIGLWLCRLWVSYVSIGRCAWAAGPGYTGKYLYFEYLHSQGIHPYEGNYLEICLWI